METSTKVLLGIGVGVLLLGGYFAMTEGMPTLEGAFDSQTMRLLKTTPVRAEGNAAYEDRSISLFGYGGPSSLFAWAVIQQQGGRTVGYQYGANGKIYAKSFAPNEKVDSEMMLVPNLKGEEHKNVQGSAGQKIAGLLGS